MIDSPEMDEIELISSLLLKLFLYLLYKIPNGTYAKKFKLSESMFSIFFTNFTNT